MDLTYEQREVVIAALHRYETQAHARIGRDSKKGKDDGDLDVAGLRRKAAIAEDLARDLECGR